MQKSALFTLRMIRLCSGSTAGGSSCGSFRVISDRSAGPSRESLVPAACPETRRRPVSGPVWASCGLCRPGFEARQGLFESVTASVTVCNGEEILGRYFPNMPPGPAGGPRDGPAVRLRPVNRVRASSGHALEPQSLRPDCHHITVFRAAGFNGQLGQQQQRPGPQPDRDSEGRRQACAPGGES